jgi:hypothetical protein
MNHWNRRSKCAPACVALLAAGAGCLGFPALAAEEMDHSQHRQQSEHAHHDTGRDELGRRLYGMKHQMSPEMIRELRQNVPLYRNYTDAQINLSMEQMGHEYMWYISPPELKADQGVLILLHGFRERGDKVFRDEVQPIADVLPTALGVGMAMMMSDHIQLALDDLQAAGAKEIVVVPVVSTENNEMYRQWLWIFGKRDQVQFATVPRVKTDAKVYFVPPPGDDPLIAEILLDYATEISTDPKNEVVIITAHGPTDAKDHEKDLALLNGLAKIVKEDGGFADVYAASLQDDAPTEIREANVKKLRAMVETAQKNGKKVLIVTNLVGARTIQAKLRDDLKGLDFTFNAKGIVQHDNFVKWMGEAIRTALEKKSVGRTDSADSIACVC